MMSKHLNEKIGRFIVPQFVPSHVCLSCDGCCRFKEASSPWRPKVSDAEVRQSSRLAEQIFSKKTLDSQGYIRAKISGGICHCAFFKLEDRACGIYGHRPFECRLYPFLLARRNEETVVYVHLLCPFVQEQRRSREFSQYTARLRQFFQENDVKELIAGSPALAGDYSAFEEELEYVFTLS